MTLPQTPSLRCPACGDTNVTAPTLLEQQSSDLGLELVYQSREQSWLSAGRSGFAATRAAACLRCGYVLVFLAEDALTNLRGEIAKLGPV